MRRGFTLHELIISLTVMSGVMMVAAAFASRQTTFLRAVMEGQTARGQLAETVGIAAALLRNVHPRAGDLLMAADSVVELRSVTGAAVVCGGKTGEIVIPEPNTGIEATSAFFSGPQPGDRMDALLADSGGVVWIALTVVAVSADDASCAGFTTQSGTLRIAMDQPLSLAAGAPVRFSRPFRLNHYRSADGRWYLGGGDWNGDTRRYNTVQPLAGPLAPGGQVERPGLTFQFLDGAGEILSPASDPGQAVLVAITARAPLGTNGTAGDSVRKLVALRR